MLRQLQLRWSGHLVWTDDGKLPKRFFHGDVAVESRRQGGQSSRYTDTLKTSLKRLHINSAKWKDLARDRPTWKRTVKASTAVLEANHITAAKAKREARKSQLHQHRKANAQPPRPSYAACGRPGHPSVSLDIFGPTAAPGLHQLLPPRPTLPHQSRRQLTLAALANPHYPPPPPALLLLLFILLLLLQGPNIRHGCAQF
nr:unnamed protein product [Spirometra erinaceieuropaei]